MFKRQLLSTICYKGERATWAICMADTKFGDSELSTLILLLCSGAGKYIIIVASRTILTKRRYRLTTRWTTDCVHLRNLTHIRSESRDVIPSFELWVSEQQTWGKKLHYGYHYS